MTEPALMEVHDDVHEAPKDYRPVVQAALKACVVAFATKLLSVLWIANAEGARIWLEFWFGFIPHFEMQTSQASFELVVTRSTLVMAVAAGVCFAVCVLGRNPTNQRVMGWALGPIVAAETLLLEMIRHFYFQPVLRTDEVWWICIPLVASAAIAVIWWAMRPLAEGEPERTGLLVGFSSAAYLEAAAGEIEPEDELPSDEEVF